MPRMEDPFVASPDGHAASRDSHRYSSFDSQLFSLNASSPSQAKRALEAHLSETERRLQEASKLGTALVEQQQRLTEKLREVEGQEDEGEIGPELRRKLIDLEKEYDDIGRESARAFLAPKRLVSTGDGTPSVDVRSSVSAVFTSQATASPSKVSVPSRKQRNQQSSRVHDIEFATEISTSLLAQVRQLQELLAERDDALKAANLENSRLELEAEGFGQRIRALDESEQRYKDENWNLETQMHELMAAMKEATNRENRLNNAVSSLTAEKTSVERELEELKQTKDKLFEEQAAAQKAHDSETHTLRRNLNSGDAERITLQAKLEEMTSQNQELAKAVGAMRSRQLEAEAPRHMTIDTEGSIPDQPTPENSPPPSPNKQTPRHGHLESETLRSSLGHAHRMIQNLKSNIHREKTEKIELKRMLQEARDELETRRRESTAPGSGAKRQKIKPDTFKKPTGRPDLLGPSRRERTQVDLDEPDWEDHTIEASPTRTLRSRSPRLSTDQSDTYHTATEAEDSFETANEREAATESDTFHTGAESLPEDSNDDLTETEERGSQVGTLRGRRVPSSLTLAKPGDRSSFLSTASTSEDDVEEVQTPLQSQPPRYRLKMNRGALRRIRVSGEAPMASANEREDSLANPLQESPVPVGQSLFSELEGLGPSSEGDFDTPVRSPPAPSQESTPIQNVLEDRKDSEPPLPLPRSIMVDSSTMTEPWEQLASNVKATLSEEQPQIDTGEAPTLVDSSTQYTPTRPSAAPIGHFSTFPTPPKTIWDESASVREGQLSAKDKADFAQTQLDVSPIKAEETTPSPAVVPELMLSTLSTQTTEPVGSKQPAPEPVTIVEPEIPKAALPELSTSSIYSEETHPIAFSPPDPEPVRIVEREIPVVASPQLSLSAIYASQTAPVVPLVQNDQPIGPELSISPIQSAETLPIEPTLPTLVPAVSFPADESPERPSTAVHNKKPSSLVIAEDYTSQDIGVGTENQTGETSLPLGVISGNIAPAELKKKALYQGTDHGAQTILSARQIDQILLDRAAVRPVTPKTVDVPLGSPGATPKAKGQSLASVSIPTLQPAPRRPSSASSHRKNSLSYPPLPPDHKQVIAAAQSTSGAMGPPLAPASALKTSTRPRTPNDHTIGRARGRRESQTSRRSSLSSFASELDERFNMRPDGMPHGIGPDTDPRMIQAITQTMIGEYLWKYTRKAVSGEMSSSRHRRYFWVHPYTRTLYWSDHGPQSGGKSEQKAKSVPIEAIRVITDDNPYPPGLHRKSLEVVTPGRRVRFTASTSQRHETWFNALSYLLLRTDGDETGDHDITTDDIDEFNPMSRSSSRQAGARTSLSSYHSRTTSASKSRATSALSIRPAVTPGRVSPALNTPQTSSLRQGSGSRLSSVLTATIRGSFPSRRGRHTPVHAESIYDASVVDHDSAEDLRQVIERQEREADRLENVRACCDGKHDVGSLSRTSRYSPGIKRFSHHSHHHH